MFEVQAEDILNDFMASVSFSCGNATPAQRQAALEYFMECGYGSKRYSPEEIRQIFKELEAQRLLWPGLSEMNRDQFDRHAAWSYMYMEFWFEKWFYRVRSRAGIDSLDEY